MLIQYITAGLVALTALLCVVRFSLACRRGKYLGLLIDMLITNCIISMINIGILPAMRQEPALRLAIYVVAASQIAIDLIVLLLMRRVWIERHAHFKMIQDAVRNFFDYIARRKHSQPLEKPDYLDEES